MSPVPEGAQLSPDGYYWWDDAGQQWQPVDGQDGGTGAQAGQGAAAFAFDGLLNQLGVSDENDGPFPVANAQTKVSFGAVWNVGTAAGVATVHVLVGGNEAPTWTSPPLDSPHAPQPDDGV